MISIRRVFALIVIFSVIEFRGDLAAWGSNQ
jgi:hypothetical protein